MSNLNLKQALVASIESQDAAIQHLRVLLDGREERAVNYLALGEEVSVGQKVVVNTTAVDLALGSGGVHFVLPRAAQLDWGWGHQMKLRYTPLQLRVNCAEEQDSPWHRLFTQDCRLNGPVLAAELHSMLPPLALAIKALDAKARIVYIHTDGGALPAAFSRNITRLKKLGVISQVITSGHSFGGDLETVNIFTGLQAAAQVAGANYIIAAMGPGIAGTGTKYGFSGLEQGFLLQGVRALGGVPVQVPRIGFIDSRNRHRGISHHTLTVLTKAYAGSVFLPLPLLRQPRRRILAHQVEQLPQRCRAHWRDGSFINPISREHPQLFSSMGRNFQENPDFFLALGAAARLAVEVYRSKPFPKRIAIK